MTRYKGNKTQKIFFKETDQIDEATFGRIEGTASPDPIDDEQSNEGDRPAISDEVTTVISESRSLKDLIQTPLTTPSPAIATKENDDAVPYTTAASSPSTLINFAADNKIESDGPVSPSRMPDKVDSRRKTFLHPIGKKIDASRFPSIARFKPLSSDGLSVRTEDRFRRPLRKPRPSIPLMRARPRIRNDIPSTAPMIFPTKKIEPAIQSMAAQRFQPTMPSMVRAQPSMPRDFDAVVPRVPTPVVEAGPFPLGASGSGTGMPGRGKTGFNPSSGRFQNQPHGE